MGGLLVGWGSVIRSHHILPRGTLRPWQCLQTYIRLHKKSRAGHVQGDDTGGG